MRLYEIEAAIVGLERVRENAVKARIGEHFISEIDHLIATAKANRDAEWATEREEAETEGWTK